MPRRSRPVPPLETFFPEHLHDDLERIKERCWRRGIALDEIAGVIRHHVTVDAAVRALAPRRAVEARRDKRLLRSLQSALEKVRRLYHGDPHHPVEVHARAMLAYLPSLPPGPRRPAARHALDALGVSRRDAVWLIREARLPPR